MVKPPQPRVSRPRDVPGENRIDCVYLTCFRSEFSVLAITVQYSGIRLHRAETLEEADFLLTVTGGTVLLTDVAFLDGSWRDALIMAREVHPLAASSIVADSADWPFLEDAYERGACAAIPKPIELTGAIHLIRTLHEAARNRAIVLGGESVEMPGRPSAQSR